MDIKTDLQIHSLIEKECTRQNKTINLIASENICFDEVRSVMSSCLTNKYAEGIPGKRYYGGCEFVDQVELIAQRRCLELFCGSEDTSSWHANVQPHSGTNANLGVYKALLKPGDTILSMNFAAGGHLTHGHPRNIVSDLYKIIQYGVTKEDESIDYQQLEELAYAHKPKLIILGYSAHSKLIDYKRVYRVAQKIGAYVLADAAHIAGLIAGKAVESPIPYVDVLTATTHKTLRGPRGAFIICRSELASTIDRAIMPGTQGGPFMHTIAAKAICFYYNAQDEFQAYTKQVIKNAQAMCDVFNNSLLRVVSGGTENHSFILDCTQLKITGAEAEEKLAKSGIYVNRNMIPFDTETPFVTSGIRLGTAWITSQGYKEADAQNIARNILDLLSTCN